VDFVRVSASTGPTATPTATATVTPTATATVTPTTSATPSPTPTATKTAAPAPAWKTFTAYAVGDLVSYQGVTYKVKEAHTSLPGWEPTALPELFEKV